MFYGSDSFVLIQINLQIIDGGMAKPAFVVLCGGGRGVLGLGDV
jgi:hypothetical protein